MAQDESASPPVEVYVDGSYRSGRVFYGFLAIEGGSRIHGQRGEVIGDVTKMHQIGGELKAAMEAVKWAKKQQRKVVICYDYTGIECWIGDLFGKPAWRTSNKWTSGYRKYMVDNRDTIAGMKKVKAHSGQVWNEQVDAFVAAAEFDL